MIKNLWWAAVAVVTMVVAVSGCTPNDGQATVTTSTQPNGLETYQRTINGIDLTVRAPRSIGVFSPEVVSTNDCVPSSAGVGTTTLSGKDDKSAVLRFASIVKGCPDQKASNGMMPSWDNSKQLPNTAVSTHIDIPGATAKQLLVDYTQCTNSCYSATYQILFVTLADGRAFWVTTSNLDPATRRDVIKSITVRD